VEGDDDGPQEIGGLRPEPYEEPEGLRVDFHAFKQKLREQVESGELQPSADLKARKKDSNVFAKKGNAPEVFLKRYRDANRSLNPYASVVSAPK